MPESLRAIARKAGLRAFERAIELVESRDPNIALRAAALVMDRAYGRPAQPLVDEGEGDSELPDLSDLELARRVVYILERGVAETETGH